MTTNYNKVKNEGLEEFRDFYWEKGQYKGRKLGIEQYESFLSTFAENIKKAVEEDIRTPPFEIPEEVLRKVLE